MQNHIAQRSGATVVAVRNYGRSAIHRDRRRRRAVTDTTDRVIQGRRHREAAVGAAVEGRRELQARVTFSKGDEIAVIDLGRAVVSEQGAVSDAADHEVSYL